ncbi:MAG: DUF4340 domain-containing protein [Candidatus Sericytochromatia bacterium]|nr:DUF4340 domain-containing protein [Candidatus Sericytochromatia bacterium]
MKDNQKFTIGLLAVAIGLGTYMYFVESKREIRPDSKDIVVWSLSEAQAAKLTRLVASADSKKETYTRKGDNWEIEGKPGREVDQVNFKSPYDKLLDLTANRRLEFKESDKAQYGLDTPSGSLVWGDDKSAYQLTFGALTPTGDSVYTFVTKDSAVYTIPKYKVDEWKNLALTPPLLPEPTPSPSATASASVSPSPSAATESVTPSAAPTAAVTTPSPSASAH